MTQVPSRRFVTEGCQVVKFLYDCHCQNDERPFMTDVDIVCNGGIIPVHSVVLMAASPILRAYIHGLSPSERERIIIHFMDHNIGDVLLVMQCLYTGQCIVPKIDDIGRMYHILDNLGVSTDKFQRCWATPADLKQTCRIRQYLYYDDDDDDLIEDEEDDEEQMDQTLSAPPSDSVVVQNHGNDKSKSQVAASAVSHGTKNSDGIQGVSTDNNSRIDDHVQDKKDAQVTKKSIIPNEDHQAVDNVGPKGTTENMEIDGQADKENEEDEEIEEENASEDDDDRKQVETLSKRKRSQKSRKRKKFARCSLPPPVSSNTSDSENLASSSSEEQSDDGSNHRNTRGPLNSSHNISKRRRRHLRKRRPTVKHEAEEEGDEEEEEARARILETSDTEAERDVCCPVCDCCYPPKLFECHITTSASKCFNSISKKCRLKQRDCHTCKRRYSRKSLEEFVNHVLRCIPEQEEEEENDEVEEQQEDDEQEANEEESDDDESGSATSDDDCIEADERMRLREPIIVLNRITTEQFEKYWAKKYNIDKRPEIPTSSNTNNSSTNKSRSLSTTITSRPITSTPTSPKKPRAFTKSTNNNNFPMQPTEADVVSINTPIIVSDKAKVDYDNSVTKRTSIDATTSAENSTVATPPLLPGTKTIRKEPKVVEDVEHVQVVQESVSENGFQSRKSNLTAATTTNLPTTAATTNLTTTATTTNLTAAATTISDVNSNITSAFKTNVGAASSIHSTDKNSSLLQPSLAVPSLQNSSTGNILQVPNPTATTAVTAASTTTSAAPNDKSAGQQTTATPRLVTHSDTNSTVQPSEKAKKLAPLAISTATKNKIANVMKDIFQKQKVLPNPKLTIPSLPPLQRSRTEPPARTYPAASSQLLNLPTPVRTPPPPCPPTPQNTASVPSPATSTSDKQQKTLTPSPGQPRAFTPQVRKPQNLTSNQALSSQTAAARQASSPSRHTGTVSNHYSGVLQMLELRRLATSVSPQRQPRVSGAPTVSSQSQNMTPNNNNRVVVVEPRLAGHGVQGQRNQIQQQAETTNLTLPPQVLQSRNESNRSPSARPRSNQNGLSAGFVTPPAILQQPLAQITLIPNFTPRIPMSAVSTTQIPMMQIPVITSLPSASNSTNEVFQQRIHTNVVGPTLDSGVGRLVNGVYVCEKCEQQFSTQISCQDHFCLESD